MNNDTGDKSPSDEEFLSGSENASESSSETTSAAASELQDGATKELDDSEPVLIAENQLQVSNEFFLTKINLLSKCE